MKWQRLAFALAILIIVAHPPRPDKPEAQDPGSQYCNQIVDGPYGPMKPIGCEEP